MNTTDLLLQMTLAATQIAQNTAPPVSDRTEGGGRGPAPGGRMPVTGGTSPLCWQRSGWRRPERKPDAQFQRAKRVRFRLRPMGVRSARVRSPYPRRRGWRSCSGAC